MPYAVIFTPEAEDNLQNIAHADPLLASRILDEAERLAQDPTSLSSPGGVPFLPQQRYSFWFDPQEKKTHIHLFFQYGQDEQSIWITGIGVVRY